ncbi:hypothetical protein ACTFIT_002695 [Dictyostelium discoideum]
MVSKLNELQEIKIDNNDPLYLKCLNHMKSHQLPNHIKLPSQYNNFIKRVNTKHILLVKENQIKSISKEMHTIQTNQYIDLLDITNNNKDNNNSSISMRNYYQQLFLQIQQLNHEKQSDNKNNTEIIKLFCIGYNKLNELQENKIDINDPLYIKCLNHMKSHQLPNHIKLPSQYNNFIKRVNTKHIILVKENQIKSISKEMHTIQTTQYINLLDITKNNNNDNNNNNNKNNNDSNNSIPIRNYYQQLFLQIQHLKLQIQQLNQQIINLN